MGYPLSHSFSPQYFASKFKREGIEGVEYKKFESLDPAFFLSQATADQSIKGFNVTIPYKELIIQFLDSIDQNAADIGAVNTVKRNENNGTWEGYNTDIAGFKRSFQLLMENKDSALILGSGGAAKAVAYSLESMKINFLIVSRSLAHGHITYADISEKLLARYQIIINTTPLGTFPKVDEFPPIPYNSINNDHVLLDLVYNPEVTAFLKKGQQQGAQIKNGKEMLEIQAEESWKIWVSDS